MNLIRIYGLFLRHFYLITRSFPRILDLIYWPSIQITLWGFISNFFAAHSSYYSGAVESYFHVQFFMIFYLELVLALICYF